MLILGEPNMCMGGWDFFVSVLLAGEKWQNMLHPEPFPQGTSKA